MVELHPQETAAAEAAAAPAAAARRSAGARGRCGNSRGLLAAFLSLWK